MTSDDLSHTRSGLQNGQNEFTITMTDSPDTADMEVVKQGLDSHDASHAAIVAREMGIPAVVGCGNTTMNLKTGDRVRVDGSTGTVTLL